MTMIGNIIIGMPVKRVRPYGVGGVGWVRTAITPSEDTEGLYDGWLRVDFGAGLMGFLGEVLGVN